MRKIGKLLSFEALPQDIIALVIARIDYANSLSGPSQRLEPQTSTCTKSGSQAFIQTSSALQHRPPDKETALAVGRAASHLKGRLHYFLNHYRVAGLPLFQPVFKNAHPPVI